VLAAAASAEAAAAAQAEAHRAECLWGPGIVLNPFTMLNQPLDVVASEPGKSWGFTRATCDPRLVPSQRVARKAARAPCDRVYTDTRLHVRAALFAQPEGSS
jgi:hypothetical protein